MWMMYAEQHWTKAIDLKLAVERLYENLGALEFDADHEAIYKNYNKTPTSVRLKGKMGRRKSKRKPPPKRKNIEPLDQQFNCPFCNHEKSCDVKMDKGRNTARITCRVCLEDFQTTINFLSEPVDVYNDWIDACESAN
ncbi:hypothetical protein FQA39_LY04602 [Lamprigera yunnana]|nr:hypothetical protein FQA39_LY04602 [Lamprigera yunnana]